MVQVLYRRSDGLYTGSSRDNSSPLPHDPATHVIVTLPALPDRAAKRWDGASGIRDATPTEMQEFRDLQILQQTINSVDGQRLVKAVIVWAAQRFGITAAQARQEIIDILKAMT